MHPHHVVQQARGQPNGHVALQPPPQTKTPSQYLQQANEAIWLQLGMCIVISIDARQLIPRRKRIGTNG